MKKKKLEKIIKQNQKDIDNLYSLIAKLALQNKDYEQVYSIKQKFIDNPNEIELYKAILQLNSIKERTHDKRLKEIVRSATEEICNLYEKKGNINA